MWSNEADLDFCNRSPAHAVSSVYFNHMHVDFMRWDQVRRRSKHPLSTSLISVRKLQDFTFNLCYELNSVHPNILISKGDG
jgi:hypothetical protein